VRIPDMHAFKKMVGRDGINSAVIAVPAEAAQGVVNTAVAAGIRAVLNFSSGNLKVPPGVKLRNVDLTVSMENLSFFLAQGEADGKGA
jgi:redox-sensing transcriptional repressor